MDEKPAAPKVPQSEEVLPELKQEVLEAFQKLTKPDERKAFYVEHPELARLYSPANFH